MAHTRGCPSKGSRPTGTVKGSYPANVTGSHLFVPSGPKCNFFQLFPQFSHLTPKQRKWRGREEGVLRAHMCLMRQLPNVFLILLTYHLRHLIEIAPRKSPLLDEENITLFSFSIHQRHLESFFVILILRNCGI